jgi:hypothetical protein
MAIPARRSPLSRLSSTDPEALAAVDMEARPPVRTAVRATPSRRPDARFIIGLLLIAASAAAGALMLRDAGTTTSAWAFARDLPAGAIITPDDLTTIAVAELPSAYASATVDIVGRRLDRAASAGELVPIAAISADAASARMRLVTFAVEPHRAPIDLRRGHVVDLWGTPEIESVLATPVLVLSALTVADVPSIDERGITATIPVTLEVPVDQVHLVITASRTGGIDVVRLPGSGR